MRLTAHKSNGFLFIFAQQQIFLISANEYANANECANAISEKRIIMTILQNFPIILRNFPSIFVYFYDD